MWWCKKGPNHVPKTTGPFVPGCCDVMTDYSKTGLFLRLYYPTDCEKNIDSYVSKWVPWIPDEGYLSGISKVLKLWLFVVRLVIWFMSGKLYIPVVHGAKIKTDSPLKCIILSHGLGGNRFLYASSCIELASHGFLVVALEHRDESACRTYYYKNKNDVETDKKTFIEHLTVKLGSSHYTLRNGQVLKRSEECRKAFELVQNVNKGVIPYNILDDLPNAKAIQFDLKQLVNLVDVDSVTMMGHSFGAATSLVTLAKEKRFRLGILLDTWMFPIKDMAELPLEIKQPLLFVNTQTFHISSNVKALKTVLDADKGSRKMYTIKHTTHESQTDSVFVVGYWLNWFMKKLKPELAIRINCSIMLTFLKEQLGYPNDIHKVERCLLNESDNFYMGLTKPWA